MQALMYRNTRTTLPGWSPIHDSDPRGIAYETDTHFVHFYGVDYGLWVISPPLTVTEKKSGTLNDWVTRVFGAVDVVSSENAVGATVAGVWRPGLYYKEETLHGLGNTEVQERLAEQALRLLVQKLDEVLLFIEPTSLALNNYSHKTRELLILACTEVENQWARYLKLAKVTTGRRGYSTNDYVKLHRPLFLDDFVVSLPLYKDVPNVQPFQGWDPKKPTDSLDWYNAYNKTKHDRDAHFAEATLGFCIKAVAANLILHCVRFGPFSLVNNTNSTLTTLSSQIFSVELHSCEPASFYVPSVKLPADLRDDLSLFNSEKSLESRSVTSLVI